MIEIVKNAPIPVGGVALGLAALGNLLCPIDERIRLLCGIASALLLALLFAKIIKYPKKVRDDLENPIIATVCTTSAMALMQLSTYLADASLVAAFIIWVLAIIGHLSIMAWFTIGIVRNFKLDKVFPTYFVCYVGIIVGAATSPIFGLEVFGRALFWLGFACYIPLLALVTLRFLRHQMPDPAKPLLCIYSAPASLSIVGYLAVYPEPNLSFIAVLLLFAQAFYLMVLAQIPRLLAGGFYPSFAAMTFPFVITATALVQSIDFLSEAGLAFSGAIEIIMAAETAIAIVLVGFVFFRYVAFLLGPVLSRKKMKEPDIAFVE